jgi:hypothetical protein
MPDKPKYPIGFLPPTTETDEPSKSQKPYQNLTMAQVISGLMNGEIDLEELNRSLETGTGHFYITKDGRAGWAMGELEQAKAMRDLDDMTKFHQKHGLPIPIHEKLVLQGSDPILAKRWENPNDYELIPYEFTSRFKLRTGDTVSLRIVCLIPKHSLILLREEKVEGEKRTQLTEYENEQLTYRLKLAVERAFVPLLAARSYLPDYDWFTFMTESAIATDIKELNVPVCRVSVFPELIGNLPPDHDPIDDDGDVPIS